MLREAKTKFERKRLAREQQIRDAEAAIMITKMWRGAKTRGAFEKELRQEANAAGVSEAEIARIVGEALRIPLTSVADVIASFSHFTPDDVMEVIGLMVARIDALESAQGATTHFHMVQGVGDDPGMDEVKGEVTEMPKHTARRSVSEGGLPDFEAMEEDDVKAAAEGRTTELFDSPLKSGEADARTPHKDGSKSGHMQAKSAENKEKALSDYVGSPTKSPPKRKAHKPPQNTTFTPLEDAARMVAEKQKAKKWEPA